MHIPDNYLSPSTDAVAAVAMVPVWVHCVRKVRQTLDAKHLAFMGVAAAFSFLLMMFNVPLPGGTTGHAVGGTLIAILLGPEAACIAVTVALGLQALLFGDGGVLAFGANCLNMAFILPFVGYAVFRLIRDHVSAPWGSRVGAIVGSYVGLNIAALAASVEFGIQPLLFSDAAGAALYCPYPLSVSIPAMMIPHLLVAGVIEAVATVAIYEYIRRVAPDYIVDEASRPEATPATGKRGTIAVGLLLAVLVVATPLGLLAEGDAWGEWDLEGVAEQVGYIPAGMENGISLETLMPDYSFAGLPDAAGYILSAVVGVAILVIAFKLASTLLPARGNGSAA